MKNKQKLFFSYSSNKLFYVKEILRHPKLIKFWKECITTESVSRDKLIEKRDAKLKKLMKHALTTVPYYVDWLSKSGKRAENVGLSDLPVVGKSDIRGNEEQFISNEYAKGKLSPNYTSGSTGEPFMFYQSKEGFDYMYATLWRGLARYGIRPGDKRVIVKGFGVNHKINLVANAKRKLYDILNRCFSIDAHFLAVNESNLHNAIKSIIRYKPDYYHGYASSIYKIARFIEENNIEISRLTWRVIVTESEKLHDFQREIVERVFNVPVIENYGSVEFGMIAQPDIDGVLCINEDHVMVEVSPKGEAIITNLDEFGFPLIRFKNEDLLELDESYGYLPYKRIKSVVGRTADAIHLPDGGILQGYVMMYPIYMHSEWIRAYQVYQPNRNKIVLRFVLQKELPIEIEKQIISEMQAIVGLDIKLKVEYLNKIPLTARGKQAFIISDVTP